MSTKAIIEITKESGEVVIEEKFQYEETAHNHFNQLTEIRWPRVYKSLVMNLSEFFAGGGNVGSVRLVAINDRGDRFVRREMYRNA